MPSAALLDLENLLVDLFTTSELRRFLARHAGDPKLIAELPEGGSLRDLAHAATNALASRGLLSAEFFRATEAERRGRAAEIRVVATRLVASPSPPSGGTASRPTGSTDLTALEANGAIDALADCYDTESSARALLMRAGFPSSRIPAVGHAAMADWWRLTLREAQKGLISGGLDTLLRLASEGYPGNPVLKRYRFP